MTPDSMYIVVVVVLLGFGFMLVVGGLLGGWCWLSLARSGTGRWCFFLRRCSYGWSRRRREEVLLSTPKRWLAQAVTQIRLLVRSVSFLLAVMVTGRDGGRAMLVAKLGNCREFVVLRFCGDQPRWPRFDCRLKMP